MTSQPTGGFTVADLDAVPDDDRRWELVDGVFVVSAAPSTHHQRVVVSLLLLLDEACPEDLEVFVAPFDVRISDDTNLQPDLVVARVADLTDANLPAAPVLAVEVLSPSTRGVDLLLKRDRLARAGCPSYWVADPLERRLIAWELAQPIGEDGAADDPDRTGYRQVADLGPGEEWTATQPFAVTVAPARWRH